MTYTDAFIPWFNRTLSKVFMKGSETDVLDNKMLQTSDVEVPKLLEMLGFLINELQNYQEKLKESLEESQIDIETVDSNSMDTEMVDKSSQGNVGIIKEEHFSEKMRTEPPRTFQDASVQTEDVEVCDKPASLCKNEKAESTGILPGTSSSCGSISNDSDAITNKEDNSRQVDDNLVQIRASKSEIDRRIAAFVEKKKFEVNELNRREFCSVQGPDEEAENSCARVDSLFFTRADGKSHIKVSRVVNLQGPQTQIPVHTEDAVQSKAAEQKNKLPQGIEERLSNMEKHLTINKGLLSSNDVYTRLKFLEERILYLESLSPEYFTFQPLHQKKPRKEKRDTTYRIPEEEVMSVLDIDLRIKQLKESLSKKASSTVLS